MKPRRIFPLAMLVAVMLAASSGCASVTAKLDKAAADSTKSALVPRLQKLSTESPSDVAAATDAIEHWDTRSESDNYQIVAPLMEHWKVMHTEDDGVARVMRQWKARLDKAS